MEANVLMGVPVESLRVYTYSRTTAVRAREALWEKDLPASAVVLTSAVGSRAVGSSAIGSNVVSHGRNTNARVIHI